MTNTRGQRIDLSPDDLESLRMWQRMREVTGPQARRARILELLGQGLLHYEVEAQTGAGIATVGRVRRRYLLEGAERAVFGYRPGGAKRLLSVAEEAHIVALACSAAPDGKCRWTTRLLAEESVRRGYVARVSRETVRVTLKHHGIKPWREKNVVRAGHRRDLSAPDGEHPRTL